MKSSKYDKQRREEVIAKICQAIYEGRDANGDWSFPSDCICPSNRNGLSFQYDERFLAGLLDVVRNYAREYRRSPKIKFGE